MMDLKRDSDFHVHQVLNVLNVYSNNQDKNNRNELRSKTVTQVCLRDAELE